MQFTANNVFLKFYNKAIKLIFHMKEKYCTNQGKIFTE